MQCQGPSLTNCEGQPRPPSRGNRRNQHVIEDSFMTSAYSRHPKTRSSQANGPEKVLAALALLCEDLDDSKRSIAELCQAVQGRTTEKSWYTTGELAQAMNVSQFTVQ